LEGKIKQFCGGRFYQALEFLGGRGCYGRDLYG